jgi:hypothetical protein
MLYVYWTCFLVGSPLLVVQFLLSLLGFGHHHDAGGDHDVHGGDHDTHASDHHDAHGAGHDSYVTWFVGLLTLRTIAAALTFFGLAGMRASLSLEAPVAFAVAVAGGAAAFAIVAWMMKMLNKLKADGTVRIERAVGKNGTVYLTVPAAKAGAGKVTLNLQNRTVEYQAITPAGELPTGAKVVVTAIVSPDTVEVVPATP